ncbi:MAG: redoxin family protein [Candidatus Moraniibacteriota bacterium]
MSKSNQENSGKKFPLRLVLIVGGVLGVIGLLLYLSSPKSSVKSSATSGIPSLDSLVGNPAPSMQLTDKDGKAYSPDNLRGKNIILFFNEGIMCYPACWNQVAALGADPKLNTEDTVAFSVVVDRPEQWQQAMTKMPGLSKATLLFDQGATVSRELGLLALPSSMHKGSIPGHTYIVLDKEGVVRYVYDDPNMANNNAKLIQKIAELNK